jgi:hypothetical protein
MFFHFSFPPSLPMSARVDVLHCHDLVCHLLGFMGDRHKVRVVSLVNKVFHKAVNDAASWKWGSDGFILWTPAKERLRLLRAVHYDKRCDIVPADWSAYCPNLVSMRMPLNNSTIEPATWTRIASQVQVLDVAWDRMPKCNKLLQTLEKTKAPCLRTLSVNVAYSAHLAAFPKLTDLRLSDDDNDYFRPWHGHVTMPQSLQRLEVYVSITSQSWAAMTTRPWALRELCLEAYNDGELTSAMITSICERCPLLVVLRLTNMMAPPCVQVGSAMPTRADLVTIARATPLLEVFCGDVGRFSDEADGVTDLCVEPRVWPRLTSLALAGPIEQVIGNFLSNPGGLRRVVIRDEWATTIKEHASITLRVLDTLRHTGAALTDLVVTTTGSRACLSCDVDDLYAVAMHGLLAVVGSTLSSLRAQARFADIGRFCPRLRTLNNVIMHADRKGAWSTSIRFITRGCPLLGPCHNNGTSITYK